MSKTLQACIKYTTNELEHYTKLDGSCVKKINAKWHLTLPPFALTSVRQYITNYIRSKKIGFYDMHLNGIILDVKNVKLLGGLAALRSDDPRMHVKIIGDCFVFQPVEGAILSGIVRHIGKKHVGALIYRVFNANLRFETKVDENLVELDKEIKFRVNNFNLQNVFPYIEGDLITDTADVKTNKTIKFRQDSPVDSGIEEKDVNELDSLIGLIKQEPTSEFESTTTPTKKARKGAKRNVTESSEQETPIKKSKKNVSSESSDEARYKVLKKKKIKIEKTSSDNDLTRQKIQIKNEPEE